MEPQWVHFLLSLSPAQNWLKENRKIARRTISAEIKQFRTKGIATVGFYFNARQKFLRQKNPTNGQTFECVSSIMKILPIVIVYTVVIPRSF